MKSHVYKMVLNRDDYETLEIDDEELRKCLNKSKKPRNSKREPANIKPMKPGKSSQLRILKLVNKIALDIAIDFVQCLSEDQVNKDDLNVSVTVEAK